MSVKLYEVWISTSAGSMTTTVVTVAATSERHAYELAQKQYPGEVVRGVLEVGSDD